MEVAARRVLNHISVTATSCSSSSETLSEARSVVSDGNDLLHAWDAAHTPRMEGSSRSTPRSGRHVVDATGTAGERNSRLVSLSAKLHNFGGSLRRLDRGIVSFVAKSSAAITSKLKASLGFDDVGAGISIEELVAGLTREQRVARAGYFIEDAMRHRYQFGKGMYYLQDPRRMAVVSLREHWAYQGALQLIVMLYMAQALLVLPDEARPDGRPATVWRVGVMTALHVANGLGAATIFSDVLLRSYVWGWRAFVRSKVSLLQGVLVGVLVVDTLVALLGLTSSTGRGFKLVRAGRALLVFRSRRVRGTVAAVVATIPSVLHVSLFIVLIMLMYAIMAIQLYSEVDGYTTFENFDSLVPAMRSLFVLLTADNYPDVVVPAAGRSGYAAWVYFASFLIVATFVSFNIVLAAMVPFYKDEHLNFVLMERVQERKALICAFALIDVDSSGCLEVPEFVETVLRVAPEASPDKVAKLFAFADADGDGTVDMLEFFDMCNLLVHRKKDLQPVHGRSRYCVPMRIRVMVHEFVESPLVQWLLFILLVANTVVFCLFGAVSSEVEDRLHVINDVFLGVFTLEVVLKLAALSPTLFFADVWSRFDFVAVIVCGLGSRLVNVYIQRAGWASAGVKFNVQRWSRGLGVVRIFRIMAAFSAFKAVAETLYNIRGILIQFLGIIGLIFYMYAIVGLDLFTYALSDEWVNFETSSGAALVLFQVLAEAEWADLMYAAMGHTSDWAAYYFLSFVVVTNILILNTFISILLEAFETGFDMNQFKVKKSHFKSVLQRFMPSRGRRDGERRKRVRLRVPSGSGSRSGSSCNDMPARHDWEQAIHGEQLATISERELAELAAAGVDTAHLSRLIDVRRESSTDLLAPVDISRPAVPRVDVLPPTPAVERSPACELDGYALSQSDDAEASLTDLVRPGLALTSDADITALGQQSVVGPAEGESSSDWSDDEESEVDVDAVLAVLAARRSERAARAARVRT
ncbi:ion transporter [Thecamonas trahens ATCC 50062]|uniref:Ion transporter n=1 Tax=Thecamonas trahens ATCC 50062 TaxID=461836 RepID=A0A0L0D653_THETB|nr:ion transporter [Thecamonas trahens ATCC 50062]KNC46793.1 ion transporter [Thecamonas trahens ATCC 50062]|eukprot:XP_013760068.1 ion transporter [Thecamonas trahens ATCC 50062]